MPTSSDIRNTLVHIKKHPGCSTNDPVLDGELIDYLARQGWVEGTKVVSTDSVAGPDYINLHLTFEGKLFLEDLLIGRAKKEPTWLTKQLIIGLILIAVGLVVAAIVYYAGWR